MAADHRPLGHGLPVSPAPEPHHELLHLCQMLALLSPGRFRGRLRSVMHAQHDIGIAASPSSWVLRLDQRSASGTVVDTLIEFQVTLARPLGGCRPSLTGV